MPIIKDFLEKHNTLKTPKLFIRVFLGLINKKHKKERHKNNKHAVERNELTRCCSWVIMGIVVKRVREIVRRSRVEETLFNKVEELRRNRCASNHVSEDQSLQFKLLPLPQAEVTSTHPYFSKKQ